MTPANFDTLLTLVDSADAAGRLHIRLPADTTIRNQQQARDWLDVAFFELRLPLLRLEVVKKAISEIELTRHTNPDGRWLTLNLAKLLLLPAQAPAAELAEFHAMLVEMKAFFAAHGTERVDIQLCNARDNQGRVYGTLTCRTPESGNRMQADDAATSSLNTRITASPALSHWLRHVALTLQKIGPWSWTLIREHELFGYCNGPFFQYTQARIRAQPQPQEQSQYRVLDIAD